MCIMCCKKKEFNTVKREAGASTGSDLERGKNAGPQVLIGTQGPTLQFSYRSRGPWLPSSSDLGGIPPPKSWGPESEAPIVGT